MNRRFFACTIVKLLIVYQYNFKRDFPMRRKKRCFARTEVTICRIEGEGAHHLEASARVPFHPSNEIIRNRLRDE